MGRDRVHHFNAPKLQCSVVMTVRFQTPEDYSVAALSARLAGLSVSSPEAFFSSSWIFNSASLSLDWQSLASLVPSSKRARSVSSGNSSDSIDSTMPSSFFSASSKDKSFPPAVWAGAALVCFDTTAKLGQLRLLV